ncbi:type I restriction endonuclease subunit R [Propionibacterium freudenreichii]|uniref:type I restriction endonuclease subunit R n=1 Tax=Propionibacterium freudenreichii TaxID=1744 RepID=UPI0006DBF1AF|nr:type I restriction endonuclease subunit R [Propionibacterium freudenreichii]MDK9348387.1 type I restriction endonuclease subunit R [Propionibacterium freudenreichii]MDK9354239.1 type I restriction endonuclease subunit R [Propionibacterium freudenreichii]MDK9628095.1 type I restriction endonuclease subunit R [Propionibacterium freudenreichii]MDK9653660.1 type I restriction endonuclease subunit R [Propionibacterium freudenreichii]SBN40109.1 Type I site-specific deoxyribonuclease, HsdR family 
MTDSPAAPHYAPIAISKRSTVVAEYVPEPSDDEGYESEATLEARFIKLLEQQAYEYLPIHSSDDLVANLRKQLESLNQLTFTDDEWARFFAESIAGHHDGIVEKTRRIQHDHIQLLNRDDGTTKNIYLLDKRHIHNNRLQVINQYATDSGARSNRYDVTILVNGLPMVQVELKRRGVNIREAFNQINRYQRESFWADSGLYEYVQLFVISNGTLTKYYSNTTRATHVDQASGSKRSRSQVSNTFEFTSWWSDATNKTITDLVGFTRTFFASHTLLAILTRYCVFDSNNQLLVMRPYQIAATERILNRIETATNAGQVGTVNAGGYIWHTTGSGKTLTSFKTAQLATEMPTIDKVLFVVDRKDLDYQTMVEYERFQKGAVNSNASTRELKRQLDDPGAKIIITTIQKLSRYIGGNPESRVYAGHTVIIFDECHRSQFGAMHKAITRTFRNYHIFGFTGTPIFAQNSSSAGSPVLRTTEQIFGDRLHLYTIVNAIADHNVLPFHVDYVDTIKVKAGIVDREVAGINSEAALLNPQRINGVVDYVLSRFDQKTKRQQSYTLKEQRVRGFNSLFATASIDAAKRYYAAFKARRAELPAAEPLKIALLYSFAPNEAQPDGLLGEEDFETGHLDKSSRDFLDDAIADYNAMFATSYDTSAQQFGDYYKDVTRRLKNRELDMAIVVNMLLTGFDAKTLNTLWVDKNLRQHGLIQAFSRTNRILNSVKAFGNIVCFRDLQEQTDEALRLFGDDNAGGVVLLQPFDHYYDEYKETADRLLNEFPIEERIISEAEKKEFIKLFGMLLQVVNILSTFDEFEGRELLSPRQMDDYKSQYLALRDEFANHLDAEKESIDDDVVFEIELVRQVEVNVDYILMLAEQYLEVKDGPRDKEIRAQINRAASASPTLRNKRDLINDFVDSLNVDSRVGEEWQEFIDRHRTAELDSIITDERLNPEPTQHFMHDAFVDGAITTTGTAVTRILPPASRFSKTNNHEQLKDRVLAKLQAFFDRYAGLLNDVRD